MASLKKGNLLCSIAYHQCVLSVPACCPEVKKLKHMLRGFFNEQKKPTKSVHFERNALQKGYSCSCVWVGNLRGVFQGYFAATLHLLACRDSYPLQTPIGQVYRIFFICVFKPWGTLLCCSCCILSQLMNLAYQVLVHWLKSTSNDATALRSSSCLCSKCK